MERWPHRRALAQSSTIAKSDFLAAISHVIRTPLNSIIGFTDILLEDTGLTAGQKRQVGLVHNSGQALLTVVNDILDFSKSRRARRTCPSERRRELEQDCRDGRDTSASLTRAKAAAVEARRQVAELLSDL